VCLPPEFVEGEGAPGEAPLHFFRLKILFSNQIIPILPLSPGGLRPGRASGSERRGDACLPAGRGVIRDFQGF